jgi:hypothetical protein
LVNNYSFHLLVSIYKTKKEKKGTKSELERNVKQCRKRREENKMGSARHLVTFIVPVSK